MEGRWHLNPDEISARGCTRGTKRPVLITSSSGILRSLYRISNIFDTCVWYLVDQCHERIVVEINASPAKIRNVTVFAKYKSHLVQKLSEYTLPI